MIYHIVAGEEMKKLMVGSIPEAIPFNEDMSIGGSTSEPFTDSFYQERSLTHNVSLQSYLQNMSSFISLTKNFKENDIIHLYFGDDKTCKANSNLLIEYFLTKHVEIYFHHMDEYHGIELSVEKIK